MLIPLYDRQIAIDPDGQVDHNVGTKAMGLQLLQLLYAFDILQQPQNLLGQFLLGTASIKCSDDSAQDENARAQDQQGNQRAGQRVHPGQATLSKEDADGSGSSGENIIAVVVGQGDDDRDFVFPRPVCGRRRTG